MTLKRKVLPLYAAVAVIILAAVGGLLSARFRHDRLEDLQRELLNQLKHVDFALTSFMAEADSNVAALAANGLVRTRQDPEFTSFLEADRETFAYNLGPVEQGIVDLFNIFRLTHPYVNSVYMGRENGSFVRSHPRAQPTQYDPRTRPWHILARDNPGKVMHTEPHPSVTTSDVNIGKDEALCFQNIALVVGDEVDALLRSREGVLRFGTATDASRLFFYTSVAQVEAYLLAGTSGGGDGA